jgi:hypothetical protein
LIVELLIYFLAATWWVVLGLLGVGSDSVQFSLIERVALHTATLVIGGLAVACLVLRIKRPHSPNESSVRTLSIVVGWISLALLVVCAGLANLSLLGWNAI